MIQSNQIFVALAFFLFISLANGRSLRGKAVSRPVKANRSIDVDRVRRMIVNYDAETQYQKLDNSALILLNKIPTGDRYGIDVYSFPESYGEEGIGK